MIRQLSLEKSKRSRGQSSERGYSLVEALMTLAVLTLAASSVMPEFRQMATRNQLKDAVRGTTQVIQSARMAAIRRGVPVVVEADFDEDRLFAFADVDDRDGELGSDLSFDPDPGKPSRNTDHEVARFELAAAADPAVRVHFWGVEDLAPEGPNAVMGFTSIPGSPPPDGRPRVAVFEPDGSIRETGSWRLAMAPLHRGSDREGNFFEIAVSPRASARIEVRKYVPEPAVGDPGYYAQDTDVGPSNWQWY